ncbi:unnamed protein product [Calypogeia fissa]
MAATAALTARAVPPSPSLCSTNFGYHSSPPSSSSSAPSCVSSFFSSSSSSSSSSFYVSRAIISMALGSRALPLTSSCSSSCGCEIYRHGAFLNLLSWRNSSWGNLSLEKGEARRRGGLQRRGVPRSHTTDVHLEGKKSNREVQSKLKKGGVEHQEIDLKEWMEEQGLKESKVQLLERKANGTHEKPIHYVAASEDLQPGDVALSVPISLVVTLERVLGDETLAELLTTNKLSELACLALYLMYEKKQGKNSFWYPYIRELDRQRGRGQLSVESPLLWSPEEVNEYFHGSPMKQVVLERLDGIKREYQELDTVWFMAGSLFKQYPFDIPTEAFTFEIFKQAFVAVQSCVVHLQGVSLARRFCLVPLGPPLLAYKSTSRAMLKAVGGNVQLEVDRVYKAGEPLVVWCGPQPNTRLLLNYGFVDEDNPFDRLSVEASLNTRDPLYQDKRILVQKQKLSTIQTFQFYKGKEKTALLEMLPYIRLGHVADPADMKCVGFAEGPICQLNPCNERAVLDQLVGYFTRRLAGYRTSLVEDIAVIQDEKADPKKRVATQLLRIEKEILGNALSAVNELISDLPDGTVAPCSGEYVPKLK